MERLDLIKIIFWIVFAIVIAILAWKVLGKSPSTTAISILLALAGIVITLYGNALVESFSEKVMSRFDKIDKKLDKLGEIHKTLIEINKKLSKRK